MFLVDFNKGYCYIYKELIPLNRHLGYERNAWLLSDDPRFNLGEDDGLAF